MEWLNRIRCRKKIAKIKAMRFTLGHKGLGLLLARPFGLTKRGEFLCNWYKKWWNKLEQVEQSIIKDGA